LSLLVVENGPHALPLSHSTCELRERRVDSCKLTLLLWVGIVAGDHITRINTVLTINTELAPGKNFTAALVGLRSSSYTHVHSNRGEAARPRGSVRSLAHRKAQKCRLEVNFVN
jgi:hypothetical protein